MDIDGKFARELKKKIEAEMNKKEVEWLEYWKGELELIYKKRYENLSALQLDLKATKERMENRVKILTRMIREAN